MAVGCLAGCGDSEDPQPVEKTVHRTVLVYMVADNSLGSWGCDRSDIEEMVKAADAGGLNGGRLLVYYARPQTASHPPQLLEITRKGAGVVKTYADDPKIYSVDPERIREVISDMRRVAPAREYGLVFWSHSNGWLGAPREGDDRYRAFGDDRSHHITIPTLAETLRGGEYRFLYFDCCQMANVESAYELRGLAPEIVASPTELGIDGMRYDLNVPVFFAENPSLEEAARNTYEDYAGRDLECQMTVIRTGGLDALAEATRAILATVEEYPEGIEGLQRYCRYGEACWSYDMLHYMELLAAESHPELFDAWKKAFDDVVTFAVTTPTAISDYYRPLEIERYCGLGAFAIGSQSDISYRQYDSTAWWRDVVSLCPAYKISNIK